MTLLAVPLPLPFIAGRFAVGEAMRLVEITRGAGSAESAHEHCRRLEEGDILFLAELPFVMQRAARELLLRLERVSGQKNIAYDTARDRLSGVPRQVDLDPRALRDVMRDYSQALTESLAPLLRPYAERWKVDYASFRPEEEAGRRLPWRSRNDLLHTDAFAARPTNGDRILRVFTNLSPDQPRHWITGERFDVLLERLALQPGFPVPSPPSAIARAVWRGLAAAGLNPPQRSGYDRFMLKFHHYLKASSDFQASCTKQTWIFPPLSTWIVFTDLVPHAVRSGRHALEQTYIVPHDALVRPELSPLHRLESHFATVLTEAR